ncbi:MAG: FAD-dependent oxidoreductase, partial [Kangiellaceae bacterium]|nr:FAD-dependent oxidoreductase [Kangiellaceae bacterium]
LYFNPGPARIPHHHEFILGYCRDFGVALEPFINSNSSSLFHSSQAFAGRPQVARRVMHDVRGYIGDLLAQAIQSGSLASQLSGVDTNSLLNLVQVFADLDQNYSYQGSERSGFLGQEDTGSRARFTQLEPIELGQLLSSNFWQFQLDFNQSLNQQATMLQPVGGMDNIARAFEQRVNQNILTNCEVQRIENTSQGVLVEYIDEFQTVNSINADFAICTIPATVLRGIDNNFSSQHSNVIQQFEYTQSGKLAFQSPRFWESQHNIYGGISWTDQAITQVWYPSANLGSASGIIVGAYTFADNAGQTFANLAPSARVDWGIQQGAALHIDYATSVSRGLSVAWPKIPFQLGGWGRSEPSTLTTPDGNVMFAGEHVSQLQGWQEGAVMSAYQAIDSIVQRING